MRAHWKKRLTLIYAPKQNGHRKEGKGRNHKNGILALGFNEVANQGQQNGGCRDHITQCNPPSRGNGQYAQHIRGSQEEKNKEKPLPPSPDHLKNEIDDQGSAKKHNGHPIQFKPKLMTTRGVINGASNITYGDHRKYPGQKKMFLGMLVNPYAPIYNDKQKDKIAIGVKRFHRPSPF